MLLYIIASLLLFVLFLTLFLTRPQGCDAEVLLGLAYSLENLSLLEKEVNWLQVSSWIALCEVLFFSLILYAFS